MEKLKRCAACLEHKRTTDFRRQSSGRLYRNCVSCHVPRSERKPRAYYKSAEYKRHTRAAKAKADGREFYPSGTGGKGPGRSAFQAQPTREQLDQDRAFAWSFCVFILCRGQIVSEEWHEAKQARMRARWTASRQARRAREKSYSDGSLTTDAMAHLFRVASHCFLCGCKLTVRAGRRRYLPTDATLDHIIPLSRGGLHGVSNVAIACMSCNFGRHDRLIEEMAPPFGSWEGKKSIRGAKAQKLASHKNRLSSSSLK